MKQIKATGEAIAETRKELGEKYFDGFSIYSQNTNMGIVSLLSDLQHEIQGRLGNNEEHYRQILNDIKCILISDDDRKEDKDRPNVTISKIKDKLYVNYHLDENNWGCSEGTSDIEVVMANVKESIETINKEG